MTNREKVLKGLECLSDENNICSKDTCPYYMFESCVPEITHDALELLKEPETRITVDAKGIRTDRIAHWIPVKKPTGVEAFVQYMTIAHGVGQRWMKR